MDPRRRGSTTRRGGPGTKSLDNDKLAEYYDDIKKTFKRDWNSLSLDNDDFCDVCVDLTLMLLTQLEAPLARSTPSVKFHDALGSC